MTEILAEAKGKISEALQVRIVSTMATAVEKAKSAVAEEVLSSCTDVFDEESLNDAVDEVLGAFDFNSYLE